MCRPCKCVLALAGTMKHTPKKYLSMLGFHGSPPSHQKTSCFLQMALPYVPFQVKRSRIRITDPSTPDMRVTSVVLDPLAHLCSPMSPLRLDPHSDASDGEAEAPPAPLPLIDGAPVDQRKRRKGPTGPSGSTKKLKDTDLLEPVVVHSDAEDVD